jgi:hypothetical protein
MKSKMVCLGQQAEIMNLVRANARGFYSFIHGGGGGYPGSN